MMSKLLHPDVRHQVRVPPLHILVDKVVELCAELATGGAAADHDKAEQPGLKQASPDDSGTAPQPM